MDEPRPTPQRRETAAARASTGAVENPETAAPVEVTAEAERPPEVGDAPLVTVRYWAAARQAAGVTEEKHVGTTVAEVLDAARSAHAESARFASVVSVCSVLVGDRPLGTRDPASVVLSSGDVIEVLPPFAGG